MKRVSTRARLTALATALVCAVSAAPAAASGGTIVGGQNASNGEWPWAAYLNGTVYSCGGSLIAEKWVLTAAHCIALGAPTGPVLPAAHISATVGRTDLNDSGSGRTIRATTAWIHPGWDPVSFENDVALLELSSAATGNPTIKIAGPGEEPLWSAGTSSTVVGWGATKEGGDGSDILKEAQVPIVDDPTCAKYVDGYFAESMLCAGFIGKGGVDSCQGDSGGPLMVPAANSVWRQAGVVSWGIGCARPNDPGVYARVGAKSLRDFIASKVPSAIGTGATRPDSSTTTTTTTSNKKPRTTRRAKKSSERKRSTRTKRSRARTR